MTSRIVAVVPAFEESEAIGSVVSEIREFRGARPMNCSMTNRADSRSRSQ